MEKPGASHRTGGGRAAAGQDVGIAMISLGADAIEPAYAAHRQAHRVLSEAYRIFLAAEDAADLAYAKAMEAIDVGRYKNKEQREAKAETDAWKERAELSRAKSNLRTAQPMAEETKSEIQRITTWIEYLRLDLDQER
jgi:predicted transcriptional regulator